MCRALFALATSALSYPLTLGEGRSIDARNSLWFATAGTTELYEASS